MRARLIEARNGPPVSVVATDAAERAQAIPALAALRVGVFRTWPYLYDGNEAYEARYLDTYVRNPLACVILARHEARIVGASTCLPLTGQTDDVRKPFLERGWNAEHFFYFGESVLLPGYRGRGIGVAFFDQREAHARTVSSVRFACFCSVVRPESHPARPATSVPLDGFWARRGYTRRPDITCQMSWTDVDDTHETAKTLVFWIKPLHGDTLP